MPEEKTDTTFGAMLRTLLQEHSMSMRKLSELTDIDTATISRIVNGKRKANLQHLERFSDCLGVPLIELVEAAGYSVEQTQGKEHSDFHATVDVIQGLLKSSSIYDQPFSINQVEEKLENYNLFSQTEEGKNTIVNDFNKKIQKVGSIGPIISKLKELYGKFSTGMGTPFELALIGGVLLYFIIPVDVIPDYIFPIGYLDDALAVQLATNKLVKKEKFN